MKFSEMTMPPFTQLEPSSHDLKSMKVNFNIFPGQHTKKFDHHWNTLVSFGDQSEEQIPTSNISKAT
jgi:hypothetical protein